MRGLRPLLLRELIANTITICRDEGMFLDLSSDTRTWVDNLWLSCIVVSVCGCIVVRCIVVAV